MLSVKHAYMNILQIYQRSTGDGPWPCDPWGGQGCGVSIENHLLQHNIIKTCWLLYCAKPWAYSQECIHEASLKSVHHSNKFSCKFWKVYFRTPKWRGKIRETQGIFYTTNCQHILMSFRGPHGCVQWNLSYRLLNLSPAEYSVNIIALIWKKWLIYITKLTRHHPTCCKQWVYPLHILLFSLVKLFLRERSPP